MPSRKRIAKDLNWLAQGRAEYLSRSTRNRLLAGERIDYSKLDENDRIVLAEVQGMQIAARAIAGKPRDAYGWLPSWRWGEWLERRAGWKS